jgi:Maltokinase N-terminal cap domain
MAVIYQTTLTPSKLDLLTRWLPAQPWYDGAERQPDLSKSGGFRLDDPSGQVGIEFMIVTDVSEHEPSTYQIPLTYRGAPLEGAAYALVGTSEHGVLGRRWIYDGAHDPVLVAQLVALMQGAAEPQAQSQSHTPDHTVTARPVSAGYLEVVSSAVSANSPAGTEVRVETVVNDERRPAELTIQIERILRPHNSDSLPGDDGYVMGTWRSPDGTPVRGLLCRARRLF